MPEDYLVRLARQMGRVLATLLGLRKEGRTAEAQAELERVCVEELGLTWRTVRQSSPEALNEHLRGAGALQHHRAILLGELLMHEAEMAQAKGRMPDAIRARVQAFCVMSEVMNTLSEEDLAVYVPKVRELAVGLRPFEAHPYLRGKLGAWAD